MAGFRLPAVPFIFALLLFQASSALAATASVNETQVLYTAAPGETNAVVFTVEGQDVRISDSGATIAAGAGCLSAGADVLCDGSSLIFLEVLVELGDGDDSADLSVTDFAYGIGGLGNDQIAGSSFESILDGGPGDDRLTGGSGDDSLHGGEGDDQLLSGSGDDQIWAYPGNDNASGGSGGDFLFGGRGDDILSGGSDADSIGARGNVNFRLTPTALIGTGSDTLSGIEDAEIFGGLGNNWIDARSWRGDTRLYGGLGSDHLLGGFGRDEIDGGRGSDLLRGGAGPDALWGRYGADVLFSRDRERDEVDGGRGWDRARVDGARHHAADRSVLLLGQADALAGRTH